jgi:rhodanese-related sulfurtransferase
MQSEISLVRKNFVLICNSLFLRENLAACNSLTELKIWAIASLPGGLAAWDLNPFFKRNLKIAWLGG